MGSVKMTPCNHDTVTNNGEGWGCMKCGISFVPAEALAQMADEQENILDTVTAVFSATLWDLHERAFEAHGVRHDPDHPLAEAVCEEKGHNRMEDGVCSRCGDSPFIGGGK